MKVNVKCDESVRVVGYYSKVESLNKGKKSEYEDREYMED